MRIFSSFCERYGAGKLMIDRERQGSGRPQETILATLSGMSPAVITETVWALARQTPPITPKSIMVLTTKKGREALRRDLLQSGVWDRLCQKLNPAGDCLRFGDTGACIRVFPDASHQRELDDLDNEADNAVAADFILENLRQVTENPDTRLIFSIAGGRKTMTALGALCLTLLGRSQDRLCHVLVNPPFDHPQLSPRFHFPDSTHPRHTSPDGAIHTSDQARITLCDIPFVRVRNLFQEKYLRMPGSFSNTVDLANQELTLVSPRRLTLEPAICRARIDSTSLELNPAEFTLYWLLAERCRSASPIISGQQQLVLVFAEFAAGITTAQMPEIINHNQFKTKCNADDLRKLASALSKKIRRKFGSNPRIQGFLPSRGKGKYGLEVEPGLVDVK
jgi:CRISPR-associated protein (TIGR02584 family)